MALIGIALSSEELDGPTLVDTAARAEQAGFGALWISDHFHPWNDEQGESTFVWAVLGAIAQATAELRVHTAVTAPIIRIHPAIVAQAAATVTTLMPGRFGLGVGTGEALNEHIFGDVWPPADTRLEMLEEAVALIRELWRGETTHHHGRHYTVEHARIYSRPDEPPPIHVSGFGPKAVALAARIGDGYMNVGPDPENLRSYREQGGTGTAHTSIKACWGPDRDEAIALAHRLWPNQGLPGELAQILPTPQHFEQATQLVTPDMIAETVACGPDPEPHAENLRRCVEAGYDEVYVAQIGPDQPRFLDFYAREVVPLL